MNKFKIGDKVKLKYFTKKEYLKLRLKLDEERTWGSYEGYEKQMQENRIFIIERIWWGTSNIVSLRNHKFNYTFHELEKVADLKNKFKYILNNK